MNANYYPHITRVQPIKMLYLWMDQIHVQPCYWLVTAGVNCLVRRGKFRPLGHFRLALVNFVYVYVLM